MSLTMNQGPRILQRPDIQFINQDLIAKIHTIKEISLKYGISVKYLERYKYKHLRAQINAAKRIMAEEQSKTTIGHLSDLILSAKRAVKMAEDLGDYKSMAPLLNAAAKTLEVTATIKEEGGYSNNKGVANPNGDGVMCAVFQMPKSIPAPEPKAITSATFTPLEAEDVEFEEES